MGKPSEKSGSSRYHKGLYNIQNIEKYIGNPLKCRFRSGWEFAFLKYLDGCEKIKKWGSEIYEIPYKDEYGHLHRYFPDYFVETLDDNSQELTKQLLIELKPAKEKKPDFVQIIDGKMEIVKPKNFKNLKALENFEYQLKTFQKNLLKWNAAKKWADERHFEFIIITEEHLLEKDILTKDYFKRKYKR